MIHDPGNGRHIGTNTGCDRVPSSPYAGSSRLQFRGPPEEERKACLVEAVTDMTGRSDIPFAVAIVAASR